MDAEKLSIRPHIKNIEALESKKPEETFQNQTLRPILKLQHDLLVAHLQDYLRRNKIDMLDFNSTRKRELLANILKKDIRFKTEIRGMVLGHFTVYEYAIYQEMSTEVNKRIGAMVEERLHSVFL